MTFRARIMTASATAVAIAVVLACGTAYLTTRQAVWRAVDESLAHSSAHSVDAGGPENHVAGSSFQVVFTDGTVLPYSGLPINPLVRLIAHQMASRQYQTLSVHGAIYRELVIPMPAGSTVSCPDNDVHTSCQTTKNAALIFGEDVSGQVHQLNRLKGELLAVALAGVLLAVLLGYGAARTAMRPLVRVTSTIEDVAETTDVTRRLDEGHGDDELERLRVAFNRLLRSVEHSQSLQRQLVMDASHELRTPLTSLRTNAQVLRNGSRLSADDVDQITADMVSQVDELAALVGDLGELARGERSEGDVVAVRLDEVVEDLVATARTHARTKDVELTFTAEPTAVLARRDRLARAINNLLGNAVKFAPRGGRVSVSVRDGVVIVEDNGPGIAAEERDKVFDRFWRSPSARSLPGSGLGLAIVAQVAHELHARVVVDESVDLGGARFTLTIPTTNEEPE